MPRPNAQEKIANTAHNIFQFHFGDMTKLADADLVTTFTPGFAGRIVKWFWAVGGTPVTTGSKACTLNMEINAVDVKSLPGVNATIALTSANCTPMGAIIEGATPAIGNNFDKDDTISVEGSSTAAFSEGDGTLFIVCEEKTK